MSLTSGEITIITIVSVSLFILIIMLYFMARCPLTTVVAKGTRTRKADAYMWENDLSNDYYARATDNAL